MIEEGSVWNQEKDCITQQLVSNPTCRSNSVKEHTQIPAVKLLLLSVRESQLNCFFLDLGKHRAGKGATNSLVQGS